MNWGNKLLVTFIAFAGGMSFLVYRSVKTNFELVEKDYYKTEIGYQQVIDGSNRANGLSNQVQIKQTAEGVMITLPGEMRGKKITGKIWVYCSYDQRKDRKISLEVNSEAVQLIPSSAIEPGAYTVKISWENEGETYFTEKYFRVN